MMDDRELLELAAKAAGYRVSFFPSRERAGFICGFTHSTDGGYWNPLTDDGDEARLEATLKLNVRWYPGFVAVDSEVLPEPEPVSEAYGDHDNDRQAARRRAGVRAAAEIGRAMP